MGLPVKAGTGIEPASVATACTAMQCPRPLRHSGAVQHDRSEVAYSKSKINPTKLNKLSVTSVLVSNTEVVHNYQFPFRFMLPIH